MHFIFDFDGTLANSFELMVEKFSYFADRYHFKKPTPKDIAKLHHLSSKELIAYLEIPVYKLPGIIRAVRKTLAQEIQNLPSFKGLPEVLTTLHQKGAKLGVLTSNAEANVAAWLKRQRLSAYFSFIHSEIHFFGKKHSLKKIVHQHRLDKKQTYYIGDETRDIEAAKGAHVHAVAVTWGFNSEQALALCAPDFIAREPKDLLTLL